MYIGKVQLNLYFYNTISHMDDKYVEINLLFDFV